jgi:hypothetical protein
MDCYTILVIFYLLVNAPTICLESLIPTPRQEAEPPALPSLSSQVE